MHFAGGPGRGYIGNDRNGRGDPRLPERDEVAANMAALFLDNPRKGAV